MSAAGLEIARRYAAEQADDSDLYVDIDADDVEFMAKACVAIAAERDLARGETMRLMMRCSQMAYMAAVLLAAIDKDNPRLASAFPEFRESLRAFRAEFTPEGKPHA